MNNNEIQILNKRNKSFKRYKTKYYKYGKMSLGKNITTKNTFKLSEEKTNYKKWKKRLIQK